MRTKKGFTLLEVLVVVVIAITVMAFAVPAYKKSQERNRFFAAQGVLIDLGTAVRGLRTALVEAQENFTYPSDVTQVLSNWQTNPAGITEETSLSDITDTNFPSALFVYKYLSSIPFDNLADSSYKGYTFYLCPQEEVSDGACCSSNTPVVACMMLPAETESTEYYRAIYKEDGTIVRFSKEN